MIPYPLDYLTCRYSPPLWKIPRMSKCLCTSHSWKGENTLVSSFDSIWIRWTDWRKYPISTPWCIGLYPLTDWSENGRRNNRTTDCGRAPSHTIQTSCLLFMFLKEKLNHQMSMGQNTDQWCGCDQGCGASVAFPDLLSTQFPLVETIVNYLFEWLRVVCNNMTCCVTITTHSFLRLRTGTDLTWRIAFSFSTGTHGLSSKSSFVP